MYNNYRDHLFASPIYLYENISPEYFNIKNTIKYEISNHLFVPMYLYENVTPEEAFRRALAIYGKKVKGVKNLGNPTNDGKRVYQDYILAKMDRNSGKVFDGQKYDQIGPFFPHSLSMAVGGKIPQHVLDDVNLRGASAMFRRDSKGNKHVVLKKIIGH